METIGLKFTDLEPGDKVFNTHPRSQNIGEVKPEKDGTLYGPK